MKISASTGLNMTRLEAAARQQVDPVKSMNEDFKLAIAKPAFFEDGDAILELDGAEVTVHSTLLCERCPFFSGLFNGRSQGKTARRKSDPYT